MAAMTKQKEPFVRIVKRDSIPLWKSILIRLAAILLSLVVCAVLIYLITSSNPVQVYRSLVDGAIGTGRRTWNTMRDTMILLAIALAITPAFKMRFWNIGAEGQILAGGIATAAVMRYCGDKLPTFFLFLLIIIVSLLAGMIWGLIPAFFKAHWNTNETLFTLMMNYILSSVLYGRQKREAAPSEPSTRKPRPDGSPPPSFRMFSANSITVSM